MGAPRIPSDTSPPTVRSKKRQRMVPDGIFRRGFGFQMMLLYRLHNVYYPLVEAKTVPHDILSAEQH